MYSCGLLFDECVLDFQKCRNKIAKRDPLSRIFQAFSPFRPRFWCHISISLLPTDNCDVSIALGLDIRLRARKMNTKFSLIKHLYPHWEYGRKNERGRWKSDTNNWLTNVIYQFCFPFCVVSTMAKVWRSYLRTLCTVIHLHRNWSVNVCVCCAPSQ